MTSTTAQHPPILLCSEAGGGSGHVTTLATVARALAPQFRSRAIIARLDHADVLAKVCYRVSKGTHLARIPHAPESSVLSWVGWLQSRSFADPAIMKRDFDWWCEVMRAIRPALVVGDYAPTALMAARALGIRSAVTGVAFSLPPATLPRFPDLLTADQLAAHGTVLADVPPPDENAIRDTINHTLGPSGLPPLARLPEVYAADLSLPRGVSLWDPYTDHRDRPLLMPVDPMPPLQGRRGGEVFIYFSTSELKDPATIEALRRLPFDACLVAPRLTVEQAQQLAVNPRVRFSPVPLPRDEIVRRARVILCAGQGGTLSLAVLSGIPVLALPVQHEQLSNALRAAGHLSSVRVLPRAQRSAGAILGTLDDLWSRPALSAAARLMAMELRDAYGETAVAAYRRLLMPLLQTAAPAA